MTPEAELLYSEDGVDLTLVRWMLSLTPDERLQLLENLVNAINQVRRDNGIPTDTEDLCPS